MFDNNTSCSINCHGMGVEYLSNCSFVCDALARAPLPATGILATSAAMVDRGDNRYNDNVSCDSP